jgi:aryl-alcohol dehydrogenase-like predicted oxidoreductase
MEFRPLGSQGPLISLVGLGCNNFGGRADFDASRDVIERALDLGVTFFDTSESYGIGGGSEECLGGVLGARRQSIVLATKFGLGVRGTSEESRPPRASRAYIRGAVDASLTRLRTDWIDLYQIHRPDPATPIAETLQALDELVKQGKVRYIGCSNFNAAQLAEAQTVARQQNLTAFVSCQNQYSVLARGIEADLFPALAEWGVGLLPYSPLAGGLLSGKYSLGAALPHGARLTLMADRARRVLTDANWQKVERLRVFAADHGHTLLELALSWLASVPAASCVMAGAMTPQQVEANAKAVEWRLSGHQREEIDALLADDFAPRATA